MEKNQLIGNFYLYLKRDISKEIFENFKDLHYSEENKLLIVYDVSLDIGKDHIIITERKLEKPLTFSILKENIKKFSDEENEIPL